MKDEIKEIAEKFLQDENLTMKNALLMASLGLTKSVGDIADLAYGVNFNQHPYNDDRKNLMAEHLGYALLNWHILAITSGISADEIIQRFSAEWAAKHSKASIKDLLKHLKPYVKQDTKTETKQETPTQQQQIKREPTQVDLTHQI